MHSKKFNAVLDRIERNLKEWDQKHWCGTSYCFAGHAAAISRGYRSQNGFVVSEAERFLGLSPNGWIHGDPMAHWLFSALRTLDDFRRVRLVAGWANFPVTA